MEDPLSPTSPGTIVDQAIQKVQHEPQKQQWQVKRGPIQPAETGTLQSKRKKTPEITITSHEEPQRDEDEDSDAETSPSDEDDYPDQVRKFFEFLGSLKSKNFGKENFE